MAVAAVALVSVAGASAGPRASDTVDWPSFGNTVDQNRHSSLTQITPANVDQLGRAFTFDLNKAVPGIKKGQQSYPVVVDGKMYVTTGDDQVFAVNAVTGELLWRYVPDNVATFRNFGIMANRGVAYCDGRVFLLTLDMTIVSLDPATGKLLARVPIARAVPGAVANYGYSETSAPICANHHLIVGAAGSEYGVRGFVMAYNTPSLTPAWANPFWTIPPTNTGWRRLARLVGGGVVWTPTTVDMTTNTLYFGTGAAMPPYWPALRPGPNPRADSVIAVDLASGKMKWWQQQLASNEWSYDSSQPPLVYTAKIGGKSRRIVSIATMEGVWFAYDAKTGAPLYQRVKVIDNVEHPSLKPGKPVVVYPASIGGLNYSPASFDPKTQYVLNAAAETAAVFVQQTSAQQARQAMLAGDVFLGLANGDYGEYLRKGWRDYGSISAIDVATGKRVWKFNTPEPERGGVTTTDSGLGFAGGGDGVMRAFDTKTGKVLWTFQTGFQIAAGPSIYAVNGKQYVAIAVGGTPTSSQGGTVASQIQVFALGGSSAQSPPPRILIATPAAAAAPAVTALGAPATAPARRPAAVRRVAAARVGNPVRIVGPSGVFVRSWNPDTSNTQDVQGHVLLAGKPVAGAHVSVDGWLVPRATDASGAFTYPADVTLPGRHLVKVVGADRGTVGGRKLSSAERTALLTAGGGISVGYRFSELDARKGDGGAIVVTGRISYGGGTAPPPVLLYSYLLRGTVTDASGKPVKGAVVTTRTNDRQYWTQSRPTGANGSYASFLVAADTLGSKPVPMTVGVAVGDTSFAQPIGAVVNFEYLKSASMNIQLPAAAPAPLTNITATALPGAIYQGLLVGVVGKGRAIEPVSASWPTASGRFRLVLPGSAAGLRVSFWQAARQFYSTAVAKPGRPVDPAVYPSSLAPTAPQALAQLQLPG
jgi:PQQ-dependent dehydrogenase (methanol/ethanol family)